MYPFIKWHREGVLDRLETLLRYELHHEAVVIESQVIEQLLKRTLVGAILQRWPSGITPETAVEARRARERIYRAQFSSLAVHWKKHLPEEQRLPAIVDEAVRPGSWSAIVFNRQQNLPAKTFGALFDGRPIKFGLIATRNILTHAESPPAERLVFQHAHFGLEVVKGLVGRFSSSRWRDPFRPLPGIPRIAGDAGPPSQHLRARA